MSAASMLYEIDGGQWDIPELRDLLETISNDQSTVEGYEVDREFPGDRPARHAAQRAQGFL